MVFDLLKLEQYLKSYELFQFKTISVFTVRAGPQVGPDRFTGRVSGRKGRPQSRPKPGPDRAVTRGSRPHGRPRPGVRPVDHACLAVNATTGASNSGDRGTAASRGDAGGREGRRGGDQTVEGLTPGTVMRTEGHGEDGRRRYRALTAADGGEVTELELITEGVPARFAH